MKSIIPEPAAEVRNAHSSIQALFEKHVVPSYSRFDLVMSHGSGSYLWDVGGRRYLDLGGGIAVCCLGHAHPEVTEALAAQAARLVHISNLYYHEHQGRLAQQITRHLGPGKVFFCNSGAEANEGLYKLARRFGHETGRYEILTTLGSFHGRTLAGIAATGQDKVKKGFEPATPGFRHVPYNDVQAVRDALSPATVAILVEGIQGEGGVTPATAAYLAGLRSLCDERGLLLLIDGVQCGHFRTGRFQSFQRILENEPGAEHWLPDGLSMAKSLGNGYPIAAFWVRDRAADLLGPGSHATTYGGTPLGCAVALKVFEIIERDGLPAQARALGQFFLQELGRLASSYPQVIPRARGLGLMLGFEVADKDSIPAMRGTDRAASLQMVDRLHQAGLLTIPAGPRVVRLLPPLNLSRAEAAEGIAIIEGVARQLGGAA